MPDVTDRGSSPRVRMSRRRMATLSAIGGLAGGLWSVGLATLSRGSEPELTIVGHDSWQVAMLETGTDRVLICTGIFEDSADPAVRRLLTTLRQHVDVIVATESALLHLDRTGALARSFVVQLDAAPNQTDTPTFRALRHQLSITFDGGQLDLERIPQDEWNDESPADATWWIRLELLGLTMVMAPDLDTAAAVAPLETTLAVAPSGEAARFLQVLPGAAIATNGYGWDDTSEQFVTAPTYLIRTFPDDPARFRFEEDRLVLPDWSQELKPPGEGL